MTFNSTDIVIDSELRRKYPRAAKRIAEKLLASHPREESRFASATEHAVAGRGFAVT